MRHRLSIIHSTAADDREDDSGQGSKIARATDQQIGSETTRPNQGSWLIDATCVPADISHPTDLSLLNEARELTERLIDVMHS